MSYLGTTQFSSSVDDDIDPDYVYYNANIINNNTELALDNADPQIRFQETRDTPIVRDASKYNFSIIRFTMNGAGKDLPLFIPVIRTGVDNPTNDINLTIYSVSMTMTVVYTVLGNPYTTTITSLQPLIYVSETQDLAVAPPPNPNTISAGVQDITTRYYWVYTYTHWLQIVNTAFAKCISNVSATYPGLQQLLDAFWISIGSPGGATPIITTAPCQMTWNPTSYLFSLYADRYSFGGADRTSIGTNFDESSLLYFNSNMFGMFSNFNNTYVNLTNERTNLILVYSILYQNIQTVSSPPAPTAKSYWIMVQDYGSTSTLWSPVDAIVFTSALLPLVFEATGDPVKFGQSLIGQFGSTQSAFQPIITDVALVNETGHDYREYIQYAPTAEYRLASFQRSKQPINNIDIQVFWRCRLDGQLYPVQMFNGSSVSVKCMFRRRGIFDYPHPAKNGVDL
nr:MAG: putative minor capsid protein [Lake Baikal virophage 12]